MNLENNLMPVILVTGCGSGVGKALAEILYRQTQYRVVITARARSIENLKLKFPETERFWIRKLDVTVDRERKELVREITDAWGGVNVLAMPVSATARWWNI